MQILRIISGPLIGMLIGYITNYLAIKMLFRPLKPIMIGKFKVPFTPGIVPKRKDEIAAVLGRAVVAKFFNSDDLEKIFTSDYFKNAVAENIVSSLYDSNETGIPLPVESSANEDYKELTTGIKEALCTRIQNGIVRSGIAGILAEQGSRAIEKRFSNSIFGLFISKDMVSTIAKPLGAMIEKSFTENGREMIMPILDNELDSIVESSRKDIIIEFVPDRELLYRLVSDVYAEFMLKHVRPIVESIDVGRMITEKVVLMNPKDVEGLVLDVVKRELNYVVLIGALLGFIIGVVNIFI